MMSDLSAFVFEYFVVIVMAYDVEHVEPNREYLYLCIIPLRLLKRVYHSPTAREVDFPKVRYLELNDVFWRYSVFWDMNSKIVIGLQYCNLVIY